MINKNSFINIIEETDKFCQTIHHLSDISGVVNEDNFMTKYVDKVIMSLVDDMEFGWKTKKVEPWITWYVWDCDFGRRKDLTSSVLLDKQPYPINCAGDLYDLISELNNKKE